MLGNLLVPETKFDSIFREAKNFKYFILLFHFLSSFPVPFSAATNSLLLSLLLLCSLNRGLTGSPWFAEIISSTLPFLSGMSFPSSFHTSTIT